MIECRKKRRLLHHSNPVSKSAFFMSHPSDDCASRAVDSTMSAPQLVSVVWSTTSFQICFRFATFPPFMVEIPVRCKAHSYSFFNRTLRWYQTSAFAVRKITVYFFQCYLRAVRTVLLSYWERLSAHLLVNALGYSNSSVQATVESACSRTNISCRLLLRSSRSCVLQNSIIMLTVTKPSEFESGFLKNVFKKLNAMHAERDKSPFGFSHTKWFLSCQHFLRAMFVSV